MRFALPLADHVHDIDAQPSLLDVVIMDARVQARLGTIDARPSRKPRSESACVARRHGTEKLIAFVRDGQRSKVVALE